MKCTLNAPIRNLHIALNADNDIIFIGYIRVGRLVHNLMRSLTTL